jgi:hypothetical protein
VRRRLTGRAGLAPIGPEAPTFGAPGQAAAVGATADLNMRAARIGAVSRGLCAVARPSVLDPSDPDGGQSLPIAV